MPLRRARDRASVERREPFRHVKEGPFTANVIDLCLRLSYLGIKVFHDPDAHACPRCHQMMGDKRIKGFWDLVIVLDPAQWGPPYVIFAELKTEDNHLDEHQRAWGVVLEAIDQASPDVAAVVWRPSMLAAIEAFLLGEGPLPRE